MGVSIPKDLSACRVCGNVPVAQIDGRDRFYVECEKCQIETSRHEFLDEAVAEWNRKNGCGSAARRLMDAGYQDVVVFENFGYDDALIGVTHDGRVVYDYDRMVDWLCREEGFSAEEAAEWIDYNTVRALLYAGKHGPIIMYGLSPEEE